jgi:glucose-6-phosphate 1-dehydrogenase
MADSHSDALVVFGVTGDLAHKMIFPALYAMAKRGTLKVPVIGVARPKWSPERLHKLASNSDVETFCALRLFIDSWRWEGVPWFVRSGKYLAETATEIIVELKAPPQKLFADATPNTNYLRFRLSPNAAIALAARVKRAGKEFVGTSANCTCLRSNPTKNRPTSGFWVMR